MRETPANSYTRIESLLSRALAVVVIASAAIAALGAALYLGPHGREALAFTTYEPQPRSLSAPGAIISGSLRLDPASLMQLGVLLLIATPVARVAFSLAVFALRRDLMYVLITLAVLAALLAGLLGGFA